MKISRLAPVVALVALSTVKGGCWNWQPNHGGDAADAAVDTHHPGDTGPLPADSGNAPVDTGTAPTDTGNPVDTGGTCSPACLAGETCIAGTCYVRADAGTPDTGVADTGVADTGTSDTGSPPVDTGRPDSGAADSGTPDTGRADTGIADSGSSCSPACPVGQTCFAGVCYTLADSGLPDTGRTDTGFPDTGVADTGVPIPDAGSCGNGRCESGESCLSCLSDCRVCPGTVVVPPADRVSRVVTPPRGQVVVVWNDADHFLAAVDYDDCLAGRLPGPALVPCGTELWVQCHGTPLYGAAGGYDATGRRRTPHLNATLRARAVAVTQHRDAMYQYPGTPNPENLVEVLPPVGAGVGWGYGLVAALHTPYYGGSRTDYESAAEGPYPWLWAAGVLRPGQAAVRAGNLVMSTRFGGLLEPGIWGHNLRCDSGAGFAPVGDPAPADLYIAVACADQGRTP